MIKFITIVVQMFLVVSCFSTRTVYVTQPANYTNLSYKARAEYLGVMHTITLSNISVKPSRTPVYLYIKEIKRTYE